MTHTENSTSHPHQISLAKRMLAGATIGLFLLSLLLFSVNTPDPAWGKFWMVRPLIIVPFAGAMGGLCNYFIMSYRSILGVHKVLAIVISIFVFVIGLWMGMVLGLDGTLWD